MANRTLVPDQTRLERYVRKGLTQAQIVDAWEQESGVRVSRSAVAMAMRRFDIESPRAKVRHEDLVPWRLKPEHRMAPEARLLRLEGQRRRGETIRPADLTWLDNWLTELHESNAVITYAPDTREGFLRVQRCPEDGDSLVRK